MDMNALRIARSLVDRPLSGVQQTATPEGNRFVARLSVLAASVQGPPGPCGWADVFGVRTDQPVVGVLLADVGGPAGHPGGREQGGVQVRRQAEGGVDAGGVEVDVGVQAFGVHHGLLNACRDVVPVGVPELRAEPLADLAQDRRPRVPGLVDPVTEAHHLLLAGRSEEYTSELQSRGHLVCRLLLEKQKKIKYNKLIIKKKKSKKIPNKI